MVSTTMAADVTSVLRDLGTGVESQGRALGSSVLNLMTSTGLRQPTSRARLARDLTIPPAQVLGWVASALDVAGALLTSQTADRPTDSSDGCEPVVVDRALTRC